ncbi:MAG TPA: hypothetical protein PK256_24795 [Verrucomicrobiota bacterium]|nr:hypothetical protein [Verrucomicrobiota bacterium]
MKTHRWIAILMTTLIAWAVQAQETLLDQVTEAKADWMFGKWEATTGDGQTVAFQISWDLNKQVVVFHATMPETEFKSYTAFDKESRQAIYISFDNRGSITRGVWGMENDELVLRVEAYDEQRGKWKMAAVFGGSSTEGLQVRLHAIDSSGNTVSPARSTFKFKKQK